MSAIGISAPCGKRLVISANADVRHEQLFFERQQSLALRGMEWEGRIKPMMPWSTLIVRGLGFAVLACAIMAIVV
jgi:hypothetical protein